MRIQNNLQYDNLEYKYYILLFFVKIKVQKTICMIYKITFEIFLYIEIVYVELHPRGIAPIF